MRYTIHTHRWPPYTFTHRFQIWRFHASSNELWTVSLQIHRVSNAVYIYTAAIIQFGQTNVISFAVKSINLISRVKLNWTIFIFFNEKINTQNSKNVFQRTDSVMMIQCQFELYARLIETKVEVIQILEIPVKIFEKCIKPAAKNVRLFFSLCPV